MKRTLALGIGVLMIVGIILYIQNPFIKSAIIEEEGAGINVGQLSPNFMLKDINGNEVKLGDFRGEKVVIVNFWATWCGPCAEEMPLFEQKMKENDDLEILAVNLQENKKTVKEWVEERGLTFSILMDPRADVKNKYKAFNQPLSFFIDKQGIIRETKLGAVVDEELDEKIEMLRSHDA